MSTGGTPARHSVVIERVVITGVPAARLEGSAISAAVTSLLARHLAAGPLPAESAAVPTLRLSWSPATGADALGVAVTRGVDSASRTARHE